MEKYQALQTHLNRIKDFTGKRVRILRTTSCGRSFDGNDDVSLGGSDSDSDSDSSRRCISVLSESERTEEGDLLS
jgi:hypothetical protein